MGKSGNSNKDKKRKKGESSPEQGVAPEQKRSAMAANHQAQDLSTGIAGHQASHIAQFSPPNYGYAPQYFNLPATPGLSVPQMLPNDGTIMNKILDRLTEMDRKLSQLDTIQSSVTAIQAHVSKLDDRIVRMEGKVDDMERSRNFDSVTIDTIQKKQEEMDSVLQRMDKLQQDHEVKECEMKAEVVDLKCRSMRDNLVFYNLEEEKEENCSQKILNFIEETMAVPNAQAQIKLHRAHRMGKYISNKTRPIVAKFAYYPDREVVRAAATNLKGTAFGVSQQFPREVQDRRRILVPIMKKEKEEGKEAYIAIDKLYIDGRLYRHHRDTA